MASTANLLLTFENEVMVTVSGDGTWFTPGDPKGVLEKDSGFWKVTPPTGTELFADGVTQIVLLNWNLSATSPGSQEEGVAYRFPSQSNDVGSFKVTTAV